MEQQERQSKHERRYLLEFQFWFALSCTFISYFFLWGPVASNKQTNNNALSAPPSALFCPFYHNLDADHVYANFISRGALLTHKNFIAGIGSFHMMAKHQKFFIPSGADTHISYLPLAHVFERLCQAVMISGSARIGYYQGDTLKLLDDVAILQPTIFVSVPRLFNRIYDKVLAGVKAKGGLAAYLFNRAYAAKRDNLRRGILEHALWDRLVFGSIRARLGGKVKHIVSGSAPISPDVIDFLRICFSADVYEGYGQTEQAAGLSMSYRGDLTPGQVGPPQLCVEVKLRDIPAMNYTSKDQPFPRGEIMLRGHSVFKGYYKSPKQTEETLDSEGWAR